MVIPTRYRGSRDVYRLFPFLNLKEMSEIHSGQSEYDYKQPPKVPTGKKYPDHIQEYNTKGKLKKLHKYFDRPHAPNFQFCCMDPCFYANVLKANKKKHCSTYFAGEGYTVPKAICRIKVLSFVINRRYPSSHR
jgi:hypothetical protein